MKKTLLALLLTVVATAVAMAQGGTPVNVTPLSGIALPWSLSNLSIVDGNLYACQNGVLVTAATSGGTVISLRPDTTLARLCPDAQYIFRNNRDSLLYFTHPDESNSYGLSVHTDSRFRKNRHVDIRSWYRDLNHPALSPDGKVMVFSSKGKVGLGGYDLWCTLWNGKRWSKPVNLGNLINTPGNEINPFFYGQYLLFSSNGMPGMPEGYNLFAVRLNPGDKVDDIIFASYVVQPLPQPLNSPGDDWEITYDHHTHTGYWMTNRNGRDQLFSFTGHLDGILLGGKVADDLGRPVPQATVQVLHRGRIAATAQTDSAGAYTLYLLPGDDYRLCAAKRNYFHHEENITLIRPNEDLLIASQSRNITLQRLPVNRPMIFDNLYKTPGDTELDPAATSSLKPVADYLRDNPHIAAKVTVYCTQSDDKQYNNIIIEQRINALRQFFDLRLTDGGRILYKNGSENSQKLPAEYADNAIFIELNELR